MKTERYIFAKNLETILQTLVENEGEYIIVMGHPQSNVSAKKLFCSVLSTLRLMGIQHQVKSGEAKKVRILNSQQRAAYMALKTGTFSQRNGLTNPFDKSINLDEVF